MKKTTKKKVAKKVDLSKYNGVKGKLNPLIKKSWITALRSGKFDQTQSILCEVDDDGHKSYCCLGVLCEVLKKKGFNIKLDIDKETNAATYVYQGRENDSNLDGSLAKKIGLVAEDSENENGEDKQDMYALMNDSDGKSFKQIARYIETHE